MIDLSSLIDGMDRDEACEQYGDKVIKRMISLQQLVLIKKTNILRALK